MEIKPIGIRDQNIDIRTIEVRRIDISTALPTDPTVLSSPLYVPVVVDIGLPIVNVPGCVEAHDTKNPKNSQVTEDDPKGSVTLCDAGVPSFTAIEYSPLQIVPTVKGGAKTEQSEKEEEPKSEAPPTETPPTPAAPNIPECPTPQQLATEPVGFTFDGGRKKIVGYQLEGLECKRIVENVPIPEQIINAIPPAGTITTTATIAVVATTSALVAKPFADILLKVVKPTVKKVMKKIAAIRKKPLKIQSTRERIVEQRQRNKAIRELREALKPKK